jgi:hypothetical protein
MAERGYEVEVHEDGSCDISHNGLSFSYDRDDVNEALDLIAAVEGNGIAVVVVDADGYRHEEQS